MSFLGRRPNGELRTRTNARVEDALLSQPVFDPADLDSPAHTLGPVEDPELLEGTLIFDDDDGTGADDMSVVRYGLGPRAPWELIP